MFVLARDRGQRLNKCLSQTAALNLQANEQKRSRKRRVRVGDGWVCLSLVNSRV